MDKKDCIIVDLEGTLSNCSHRIHHRHNKNYNMWNKLFPQDSVNEQMVRIIKNHIMVNREIILCTAKSACEAKVVMEWMHKYNLLHLFDSFYYRDKDDNRLSVDVKKDILDKILNKWNVITAYDDRSDICQMYLNNGILAILFGWETVPKRIKTPADRLKEAAELFEKKNKEYGSSYKEFGAIMLTFFPDGIVLKTEKDFTRWGILNMLIAKISRYCKNFTKGGHIDSLVDSPIYSAMLAEIDQLRKD